ncbi:MAG: B12-binding domain-containing radical SAM protein [Bradymonadales bacterium]|nr:B12-binding domain-containing radical SAM protein [Bradymonadales bacterium]
MRILFISPRWAGYKKTDRNYQREMAAYPLTLGILAGLSEGHQVRLVDEHREPVPFDEPWDLVGITTTTYRSNRAYQIADRFRELGIRVVLGGIHPTLMPTEALQHADAVVRGEAEPIWGRVLSDAENGTLGGLYEGGMTLDMASIPFPRRDLYGPQPQPTTWIQATRGCSLCCKFCYLQYTGWGTHRQRPVELVIEEMKTLSHNLIFLVDDNLFVDRDYAMSLMERMIPLNKLWWSQAPTTVAYDEELLELARRSGCYSFSIGFQSINRGGIRQCRVMQNRIERYHDIVRALHRHNILVDATFIFGFDADTPNIFQDTVDAITDLEIDAYAFYFLTPCPGTRYFDELDREGRIFNRNWEEYDWTYVVHTPKTMSVQELERGYHWAWNTLDNNFEQTAFVRERWALSQRVHQPALHGCPEPEPPVGVLGIPVNRSCPDIIDEPDGESQAGV